VKRGVGQGSMAHCRGGHKEGERKNYVQKKKARRARGGGPFQKSFGQRISVDLGAMGMLQRACRKGE